MAYNHSTGSAPPSGLPAAQHGSVLSSQILNFNRHNHTSQDNGFLSPNTYRNAQTPSSNSPPNIARFATARTSADTLSLAHPLSGSTPSFHRPSTYATVVNPSLGNVPMMADSAQHDGTFNALVTSSARVFPSLALPERARASQSTEDREEGELSDREDLERPVTNRPIVRLPGMAEHKDKTRTTGPRGLSKRERRVLNRARSSPHRPQVNVKTSSGNGHVPMPAQNQQVQSSPSSAVFDPITSEYLAAQRKNAKDFLLVWHRNGYTHSQLVQQGLDSDFLAGIYEELGLEIRGKDKLHKQDTVTQSAMPTIRSTNPTLPPKPPSVEGHQLPSATLRSQPTNAADSPSSAFSGAANVSKTNTIAKVSSNVPHVNGAHVNSPKVSKALSSQLNGSESRAMGAKPQSTVSDRQDYIARLQEAKMKKAVGQSQPTSPFPSDTTKQATTADVPDETMLDSRPSNTNISLLPTDSAKTQNAQIPNRLSSPDPKPQDGKSTAADKRRAQTELARLKMHALIAAKSRQLIAPESQKGLPETKSSRNTPDVTESETDEVISSAAVPQPDHAQDATSVPYSPSTYPSPGPYAVPSSNIVANPDDSAKACLPVPAVCSPVRVARQVSAQIMAPSRIPGLFMTSPFPSEDTEMPLISEQVVDLASTRPENTQPVPLQARKRLVASDFDSGHKLQLRKRPFGQPRNLEGDESIIIEVSEDESTDGEYSDPSADASENPSYGRTTKTSSVDVMNPSTGVQSQSKALQENSSRPPTVPILSAEIRPSTPLEVNNDLQAREQRILLMKKKIAEMEQKRNAKASGATTPTTSRNEDSISTLVVPSSAEQILPNTGTSLAPTAKTPEIPDRPVAELETGNDSSLTPNAAIEESSVSKQMSTPVEPIASSTEVAQIDPGQALREKRRDEIHADLPALDASLESHKTKLDTLRQQMKELENAMQKEAKDKERLVQELEKLGINTTNMSRSDLQSVKNEILESAKHEPTSNLQHIRNPSESVERTEMIMTSSDAVDNTTLMTSVGRQNEVGPNGVAAVSDTGRGPSELNAQIEVNSTSSEAVANAVPVAPAITQGASTSDVAAAVGHTSEPSQSLSDADLVETVNDAYESMSFGESSDDNDAELLETTPVKPITPDGIEVEERTQLSDLELLDVVMQNDEDIETEEDESESSYAPELHPPLPHSNLGSTHIRHRPVADDSSSDVPAESLLKASRAETEVLAAPLMPTSNDQSMGLDIPGEEVLQISGSSDEDEEEYEPPDAPTGIDAFTQDIDDAISEASDSDYEPPDAVRPVPPSNSDMQDPTPVATDRTQQATNQGIDMVDKADDLQQEAVTNRNVRETNLSANPAVRFQHDTFTPYQSPLTMFKSFRYHPEYSNVVAGGIRSLTYSHNIDPNKELCAYEAAGGICNDPKCEAQHFRSMSIGDDEILKQIGTSNPGRTNAEKQDYNTGLRLVLSGLRPKNVKDATAVAAEIFAYRRRFLNDPTRILNL